MMVTVRMFARAKDLAGADVITVEVEESATVEELRRRLAAVYPRLKPLLAHSVFAMNNEYADAHSRITPDAEIALLPPVSGG
jgi:molybdopterin converting factor subunit 1